MLAALALPRPAQTESAAPAGDALAGRERPLLEQLNDQRLARRLRPLKFSLPLARAAEAHGLSMGRIGYFSHTSADGTPFHRRIARFYPSRGYVMWKVGETLMWGSPDVANSEAIRAWLASPVHRRVMLNAIWREVGIATIRATNAPGVFGGADTTIVVADFGARF